MSLVSMTVYSMYMMAVLSDGNLMFHLEPISFLYGASVDGLWYLETLAQ